MSSHSADKNHHQNSYGSVDTEVEQAEDDERFRIDEVEDEIYPPFNAKDRESTVIAGVFNIICTSLDGTVLTIPYVISKCGVIIGPLIILMFAITTVMTLQLICTCARKIRGVSYPDVVEKLLGLPLRIVFSLLLLGILFAIVVGFLILMRQIGTNVVIYAVSHSNIPPTWILIVGTCLSLPMMLARNLYQLRFSCYISCTSVVCLLINMLVLVGISASSGTNMRTLGSHIKYYPTAWNDLLESIPIVSMLYLSHFNIMGVFTHLQNPIEARINQVIYFAVGIITAIFIAIGLSGYFIFVTMFNSHFVDNFVDIFDPHDPSLIVGRVTLLVTVICTIPVMMVPARELAHEIYNCLKRPSRRFASYILSRQVALRRPYQSLHTPGHTPSLLQMPYKGARTMTVGGVDLEAGRVRRVKSRAASASPSPGRSKISSTSSNTRDSGSGGHMALIQQVTSPLGPRRYSSYIDCGRDSDGSNSECGSEIIVSPFCSDSEANNGYSSSSDESDWCSLCYTANGEQPSVNQPPVHSAAHAVVVSDRQDASPVDSDGQGLLNESSAQKRAREARHRQHLLDAYRSRNVSEAQNSQGQTEKTRLGFQSGGTSAQDRPLSDPPFQSGHHSNHSNNSNDNNQGNGNNQLYQKVPYGSPQSVPQYFQYDAAVPPCTITESDVYCSGKLYRAGSAEHIADEKNAIRASERKQPHGIKGLKQQVALRNKNKHKRNEKRQGKEQKEHQQHQQREFYQGQYSPHGIYNSSNGEKYKNTHTGKRGGAAVATGGGGVVVPKPMDEPETIQHKLHYFGTELLITGVIIIAAVFTALLIPDSVSLVWQVAGSLICITVAVLIPAVSYLRLRKFLEARTDVYVVLSYMAVLISAPLIAVCTYHNVSILF